MVPKTVFGSAFSITRNSEEKAANLQSYYSFCKATLLLLFFLFNLI